MDAGRRQPGPRPWTTLPDHHRWLAEEADRLLEFARGAVTPDGFGWLDDAGELRPDAASELWITTRMTYAFALATLWGRPGAATHCRHGLTALNGALRDREHGGWFTSVRGQDVLDGTKNAYETAFVVLCSSAALTAGLDEGRPLLDEALHVLDTHFWSEADGLSADAANQDFSPLKHVLVHQIGRGVAFRFLCFLFSY